MKKIPTMFVRDEANRALVTSQIAPGCEWVVAGEGVATRKYDGTSCAVIGGKFYKRFEAKLDQLKRKPAPEGAILCDKDPTTLKAIFWVPVGDGPEDKWHREAWATRGEQSREDGTYELVGPKVQGDPERIGVHRLVLHSAVEDYPAAPRDYEGLRAWLAGRDIEGLVFHHLDGRMAKIKLRDFGLKRRARETLNVKGTA
jgi:hypothetical protein